MTFQDKYRKHWIAITHSYPKPLKKYRYAASILKSHAVTIIRKKQNPLLELMP